MANKTHRIKLQQKFAKDVMLLNKTFEIRKNDRGYEVGDYIKFYVVDNHGNPFDINPFERLTYEITYIIKGGEWGLDPEYVVFGIKPIQESFETLDRALSDKYKNQVGILDKAMETLVIDYLLQNNIAICPCKHKINAQPTDACINCIKDRYINIAKSRKEISDNYVLKGTEGCPYESK